MSRISRQFLGWSQSAIDSCVQFLLDRYAQNGFVDFTPVTIVLPTRRAGRRLREVLLDRAAEAKLAMLPPHVTTVGSLPELLYRAKFPFATPLVQQLAWAKALKESNGRDLRPLIPNPPDADTDPRWLELADLLLRQHLELSDHQLNFSQVAERGKTIDGFTDFGRWTALARIQNKYLGILDRLQLWDRPTARNYAIEHRECCFDGDLILLGTSDLSRVTCSMLDEVSDSVTAFVFADPSWADRFDQYGCVSAEAWQSTIIGVRDHHILMADGPANQADAVIHAIDQLDGKYSAEEMVIAVPDAALVPHLENKLNQFEMNARWGPGGSLAASGPAQWLRIVADYVASERYDFLAELVRHPDTNWYLSSGRYSRDAAKELDRYYEDHLPDRIPFGGEVAGDPPGAVGLIQELLQPLSGHQPHRSPSAWCEPIRQVLLGVYGSRQLHTGRQHDVAMLRACEQIDRALQQLSALPAELSPQVSAAGAILMTLGQIDDEELPPPASTNTIEMIGWLDAPLDDTKVAIVTNMNEGVVPRMVSSDVFLPDSLRQTLGLDDNARRYARDAYALQSLLESRMAVRLVVGRRAASNDPLRPSRLLLAVPRDQLAQRCLRLFDNGPDFQPIVWPSDGDHVEFAVPRPIPLSHPIESLSVSDFRKYLDCPYRFYLSKVHRLRAVDDKLTEIDARMFGNLAHQVVEDFGNSQHNETSDADEIRLYFFERLTRLKRERFGPYPRATIQVQLEQLKSRLSTLADKQAEWRSSGWKIWKAELVEERGALVVDGQPMCLKGRVDRIDHRIVDGNHEYALLDYKTSEVATPPAKKHLRGKLAGESIRKEHWVDLQLPLYRHLVKSMPELDGHRIRLGYIMLPAAAADCRFAMADWSQEELSTADQAAADIVRKIRQEQFWPPTDPYPYQNLDEFAAIVQHRVFGREPFAMEVGA